MTIHSLTGLVFRRDRRAGSPIADDRPGYDVLNCIRRLVQGRAAVGGELHAIAEPARETTMSGDVFAAHRASYAPRLARKALLPSERIASGVATKLARHRRIDKFHRKNASGSLWKLPSASSGPACGMLQAVHKHSVGRKNSSTGNFVCPDYFSNVVSKAHAPHPRLARTRPLPVFSRRSTICCALRSSSKAYSGRAFLSRNHVNLVMHARAVMKAYVPRRFR